MWVRVKARETTDGSRGDNCRQPSYIWITNNNFSFLSLTFPLFLFYHECYLFFMSYPVVVILRCYLSAVTYSCTGLKAALEILCEGITVTTGAYNIKQIRTNYWID